MNIKCFLIAILVILSSTIFGQENNLVKIFDKTNTQGGDVILIKSSIKIEGNNTFRIFEIEAPEDGDYYLSSWLMAAQTNDGFLSYTIQINGEEMQDKIKPIKSNWQQIGLTDSKGNSLTVKLIKGINTVAFKALAPEIPEVEFVRFSKDAIKAEISGTKYADFINSIKDEMINRVNNPVVSKDSLDPSLKSDTVMNNPGGNYYQHIGVSFSYTTYKTIFIYGDEQVTITTNGSSGYQHVLEVFSQANPEAYSWVALSNSSGATLTITPQLTGIFYVRVRAFVPETQGLVNLNISTQAHGNYYYANCAVSGSEFRDPHDTPTTYNYFTSYVSGDSFIWIEDNSGIPGKIRAFNDNYSGSGDFSWGVASRVKKDFSMPIAGALISSSSSNNPTGTCDVYTMCQDAPTSWYFPNLKADDAILSGNPDDHYNCFAWGGGSVTVGSTFPFNNWGNPYVAADHTLVGLLDNYYGNVYADGSSQPRWGGAPTYTRTGANLANAEIVLFGSLPSPAHAAVTKYANNQPHGYAWESKCGDGHRMFHEINSLNGSNYGNMCGYYTRVQQLKSQRIGNDDLSYEQSIKKGLTVIDVADYSTSEQTKISKLQAMIPDNEKLVFDYLFSTLKTKWDSIDKSNMTQISLIPATKEYQDALNYFYNKPDNRCLLFNKIDEANGLAIWLLGDISKNMKETVMDEVLAENSKNQYTKDGAYIALSITANVKKYVKKLLNITDEKVNAQYSITGVPANVIDNSSFSVFPNPVKDNATISFNIFEPQAVAFEVCDVSGRKTDISKQKQLYNSGHHSVDLDLSGLTQGVYLCNILVNNRILTYKLIKQ